MVEAVPTQTNYGDSGNCRDVRHWGEPDWILGVLVYNIVHVPWLLDAESGQQISTWEERALAAESVLDDREKLKRDNKELHDKFSDI